MSGGGFSNQFHGVGSNVGSGHQGQGGGAIPIMAMIWDPVNNGGITGPEMTQESMTLLKMGGRPQGGGTPNKHKILLMSLILKTMSHAGGQSFRL